MIKPLYKREYEAFVGVVVYKIRWNEEEYVLKIISKEEYFRENIIQEEFERAKTLGNEHPHFCKGIDIQRKKKVGSTQVEVLFEYGGETLLNLMETATKKDMKIWILQSLIAFTYMEARRISHFDIKPNNMVYKNGILKIIDLGTTLQFTYRDEVSKPLGGKARNLKGLTEHYCPPEVLDNSYKGLWVPGKIDSYCWGMSFYQLLTKKSDDQLKAARNNFENVTELEYMKFLNEVENSKELEDLDGNNLIKKAIVSSLQYDPQKRYGFEQLYQLLLSYEDDAYLTSIEESNKFNLIGISYLKIIGNNEKALHYFTKALSININLKGEEHQDTAGSYDNIGSTYDNNGRL